MEAKHKMYKNINNGGSFPLEVTLAYHLIATILADMNLMDIKLVPVLAKCLLYDLRSIFPIENIYSATW